MRQKLRIIALLLTLAVSAHAQTDDRSQWLLNAKGLTYDQAANIAKNPKTSLQKKFDLMLKIENLNAIPLDSLINNFYLPIIRHAEKEKDKTSLMCAYTDISLCYISKFKLDSALLYLDKAAECEYDVTNERVIAKYNLRRGYYYSFIQENTKAAFCHFKAIPYYEKRRGYEHVIASLLMNTAMTYYMIDDLESLKNTVYKMESYKDNDIKVAFSYNYLCAMYYDKLYNKTNELQYMDSVKMYNLRVINIYQQDSFRFEKRLFIGALNSAARAEIILGKFDHQKIENTIRKSEQTANPDDYFILKDIQSLKGYYHYYTMNYSQAERECLKGLEFLEMSEEGKNDLEGRCVLYDLLELTAEARKDYAKALKRVLLF
jgi:hypothetical protein